MKAMAGHRQGFTLLELVIVIGVMTVLNGIGILFLLRYLEVQHRVSAQAQLAVRNHMFLRHLKEDVNLSERVGSSFRERRAASDCLILEGRRALDRRVIVYRVDNGQVRREEYRERGQECRLLSDRGILSPGQSVSFSQDRELPRLLWVEIGGPPLDRSTSQTFMERAALCLPFAPVEPLP